MTRRPKASPGARSPDFRCVGAQKAGTTWLHVVMRESSGVFVPPIKEGNYLLEARERDRAWARRYRLQQIEPMRHYYLRDRLVARDTASSFELLDHYEQERVDDDWYRRVFGYALAGQVAGEVCPSYMCMPMENIEHALRLNPELRVILFVRDPVDRLWSQIRMNTRYGLIDRPVEALIRDERGMHTFLEYSDYARSIERWTSALKPGHLGLFLYDRISQGPRALASEIFGFIGAPAAGMHGWATRTNIGQEMTLEPEHRAVLLEWMRPQYAYLRRHFPEAVDSWLGEHERAILAGSKRSA
ncbi:MAG: sulfotransferase [Phycisphaerales bacterium]